MSAGARSQQGPDAGPGGQEPTLVGAVSEPAAAPEAPSAADAGARRQVRRRRRRQVGEGRRLWSVTVRLSLWERALVTSAAAQAGGLSAGAWLAQAAVRQAEADLAHLAEAAGSGTRAGFAAELGPSEAGTGVGAGTGGVGTALVVGELRAAVRQLVRYGVLLNQLVAQVHATGDVAHLAGGLRVAVDRCEARSAAVAVLAAELAISAGAASPSAASKSKTAAGAAAGGAAGRRDVRRDAPGGAAGGAVCGVSGGGGAG